MSRGVDGVQTVTWVDLEIRRSFGTEDEVKWKTVDENVVGVGRDVSLTDSERFHSGRLILGPG